ncbi:MAG TPA: hypothetical protein DET40_24900 [Lentisphaeria bacterium]|nr:MAG: hypothetical protein A2X45_19055 [Lentisphaerae bacterium GWF2_50_93]HCE46798.1 hypothetical protein [Lentisphaeria bacterium]
MKTRKNQEGQAIVEMTVSLIGMAAIFCGLILVAKLTTSNIENVLSARGNADENGTSRIEGDSGDPIQFWDVGADSYQYSPDDVAMVGTSEDQANFKGQLVVADSIDPSIVFRINSSAPAYVDSEMDFKNLQDLSLFLGAADLTSGSSTKNVPIDDMPLAGELFLDNSSTSNITLQDTLYMPFMKDMQ